MSKNSSFFWVILILAKLYSSNLEAKSLFQYIGVKANFPAVDFDVSQLEDETTAEVESQDTLGYISRDPEIIGLFAKVGHFSLELAHNISDDERTVDYKNLDLSCYHKRFSVRVMASQIEDFFLNQKEIDKFRLSFQSYAQNPILFSPSNHFLTYFRFIFRLFSR